MRIALITLILFFSNQDLVTYKSVDFHFEILFPADYTEDKDETDENFASIDYIRLSGSNKISNGLAHGNIGYRLICYSFKRKPIVNANELNFNDLIIAYTDILNESSFIANNLTVTSKQESKNTIYYVLENEAKGIIEHRKIIIQDSSTYAMSVMTNKIFMRSENVNAYFNSLSITK